MSLHKTDMLDQLIQQIRADEPEPAAVQEAASRVRARLFPRGEMAASAGTVPTTIRSCADVVALIPT
jgi:hypothetical protein